MSARVSSKRNQNFEEGTEKKQRMETRRDAMDVLKDMVGQMKSTRVLVFGGRTGWLGGRLVTLLKGLGVDCVIAKSRMENRGDVSDELDEVKPTHVLNAAGVTGRPNVDWCEDHRVETIRANVIGTLTLADLCHTKDIHCTIFATGCIFKYDDEHKWGGKPFTEEDNANFFGSFYSLTKGMVEQMLKCYKGVAVLRVRMPISDDLLPRNFLTKISKYERVVNIPNSMTVLFDLLPVSLIMSLRGFAGVYNFTNPGVISHNECLDLYKEYIDTSYTYTNFTVEEQDKILKAERSNNELSGDKLLNSLPDVNILGIKESMKLVFQRMRENLKNEGNFPPKRTDLIRPTVG